MKLTASDIISAINGLPTNRAYHYINPRTRGVVHVIRVDQREGPIIIKRYNPESGGSLQEAEAESISRQMIWRYANAFVPGQPINIDRVMGGSYNTRSVLETLLAYTPQFYVCNPGRIENIAERSVIKHGHKHLAWFPNEPHELGVIVTKDVDVVISEIPGTDVIYDSVSFPVEMAQQGLDIDIARRHAQMQIALIQIGLHLQFRTWIAQNDHGIIYQGKRLGQVEGVIARLGDEQLLSSHQDAVRAALLIDCIWFKNGRLMPAVIEVEHSTGVTSGLTRMKGFKDAFPPFPTRYVVVAADEDRGKVVQEANREQFKELQTRFFPYSAVEELYGLCQRRKLRGVTEEFLDSFMEPVVQSAVARV